MQQSHGHTTTSTGARTSGARSGRARWAAGAAAVALLATGLAAVFPSTGGPAAVAGADVAPVITNPGAIPAVDLDSLDPTPIKQWGVVGTGSTSSAAKPQVWDIVEIGDTIYVGGNFTGVQRDGDDPTSTVQSQAYLAAFDRDTGAWISTFRPTFNRTIYALEASSTGKLLVGGEFTTVNGVARAGLVELDPTTGAIDPTFKAYAEGSPTMVREIVRAGSQLYVAGQFYYLHGNGADPWLWNAARIDGVTGAVDLNWIPKFAGGIWDLAIDNDHQQVSAAGYFTSTNAQPNTALLATVTMATGAYIPNLAKFTPNQANQTDTTSVIYANNRLYVGGAQHIVQVLDVATHNRVGYNTIGSTCTNLNPADCTLYGGGDMQTMEVTANGIILAGCHCFGPQYVATNKPLHYSSFTGTFTNRRFTLAYNSSDSKPSGSFIPGLDGKQWGTYAIDADSRGCYYVGGDYARSAAGAWIGGFARFCKPVVAPASLSATSGNGGALLTWPAAATQLPVAAYKVYRNGVFAGDATGLSFGVAGLPVGSTQNFTVYAKDASGRLSPGVSASVVVSGADTAAPTVPTNAAGSAAGSTVTLTWGASTDLPNPGGVGLSGYLVHRDWNYLKFVPAGTLTTTDVGVADGPHRYEIRAVDLANNISAPAPAVNLTVGTPDATAPTVPSSPGGSVAGSTVTLTWGASTDLPSPGGVGLSGYLVHRDWNFLKFVPAGTLTTTDVGVASGSHRYEIRAVDINNNISAPAAPLNLVVP
ncbi:MAG: delta-60 repeat domain-containing protein [Acidimicrobiales bacterium]